MAVRGPNGLERRDGRMGIQAFVTTMGLPAGPVLPGCTDEEYCIIWGLRCELVPPPVGWHDVRGRETP